MADPRLQTREEIEIDALRALTGAADVLKRLLIGLELGDPPVASKVYLTKSRVKEHESLVLKVLDRRKGDPEYTAKKATDIVGLRLLTLFRNELPKLLSHFLYFVEWAQKEPFALFYGNSIADAVKEITIYATADVTDVYVDLFLEEFAEFGFKQSYDGEDARSRATVKVVRKATQYSSIHFVLWAKGVRHSENFRIPIEVQLRTSLEDVWGEIDHMLKYKNKRLSARGDLISEKRHHLADRQLRTLKKTLDAASEVADEIEEQFRTIADAAGEGSRANRKSISSDIERLYKLDLPGEMQEDVDRVTKDLFNLYREMLTSIGTLPAHFYEAAFSTFSSAAREFHRVLADYKKSPIEDAVRDEEICYRLGMEEALCHYWHAALARRISANKGGGSQIWRTAIKKSLRCYLDLSSDPRFAGDPVLPFRIGNAWTSRGDAELALEKYKEAVARMEKPRPPLAAGHYLRMRVPRQLGVAYWEVAERHKRQGEDLGDHKFMAPQRQQLYLNAVDTTYPLYGMKIVEGVLDQGTMSVEQENYVTANNILEYVVCFLNAGGSLDRLDERGLDTHKLNELLTVLIGSGIDTVPRPTIADTIRALARYLDDRPLAVSAANRVLALIDKVDLSVSLPDVAYIEMRRDAQRDIEQGLRSLKDC